MRLLQTRRWPPTEQVDAAHERVSAIVRRSGWVPRVPEAAKPPLPPPSDEPTVVRAGGRLDSGASIAAAPDVAASGRDASGQTRAGGRHARRPTTDDYADVAAQGDDSRPDHSAPSPLPAAVADRLPLPIRVLAEGLPVGVRNGQLELQPRHAVVLALVIALGLTVTALVVGWGRPRVAAIDPGAAATVLATGTPAVAAGADHQHGPPAEPTEIVVHVAGEVGRPGIVELPPGSRVVDAIEAAGGLAGEVDHATLNLARIVTDGEQIFVGVDPPPAAAVGGPAVSGMAGLVNLNAATAEQLATLPGIGPALAERIVQWREQHGRFTAAEELLEVSGIGPAKYEALASLVTL